MTSAEPGVWLAPAKLNLFLHVTGRRPDGYHTIQSAMRMVDLADRLTIVPRADGVIARSTALDGVPEDADLVIRAARLLQAASGTTMGATIGVEKHIPMGGGLGGGSSDAATVLVALDRLWGLGWPRARLAELGLNLGADVPFFVGGGDAFVEGIGEVLTPVDLPPACYAIVHPGVGVPTVAIFTAPELTRNSQPLKISDFSANASGVLDGSTGSAGSSKAAAAAGSIAFRNDLEPVAAARFPAVEAALAWLGGEWPGAHGVARMSGSGACVFRAFDRLEAAAACIAALPAGWKGWSVQSLARHPHRQ